MVPVHYIYIPHQSRAATVCRHAPCPPIFSPASSGSFPVSHLIAVCPVPWFEYQAPSSWSFQLCSICNAEQISFAFPLSPNKAAGSSHQTFNSQISYGGKLGGAEEWCLHIATSEDRLRGPSTAEELFSWNMVPVSSSPGSLPRKVRIIYYTFLPSQLNYWPFLKQ